MQMKAKKRVYGRGEHGFEPMKIAPWLREAIEEVLRQHGVESVEQLPENIRLMNEVRTLLAKRERRTEK